MKISARNTLKGKVKVLNEGAVMTEITIELPGGFELAAVITKESAANLGLSQGQEAYAVIKASDIMIAVD